MSMIMFILSSPGFLWLLGAGGLVGMFKPIGLVIVIMVQIALLVFMRYWNQKNGLSRFVKVVAGVILAVTNIAVVVSVFETWDSRHSSGGGWGLYMMALGLAPVISICFYLLLMRLILKLAHKISLLLISK